MRIQHLVASALLALGMAVGSASASTMQEAAEASFQLFTGDRAMCSMTYVGRSEAKKNGKSLGQQDFFLTAAHCVDGKPLNTRVTVLADDLETPKYQEVHYLEVVRAIKDQDVALVRTQYPLRQAPAPIDVAEESVDGTLTLGEKVMVIGYPLGLQKTISTGEFTGKAPSVLGIKAPLYRATAPIKGGSSGGALYVERGEGNWVLIGTTFAMRRDSEFINYWTSIDKVHNVLRYWEPFDAAHPKAKP